MTIPLPDRSGIATEKRNPRSMNLHRLSISECVTLINEEDRSVPLALERARPSLVSLIGDIEPRFGAGGRLIYLGAGTSGRLGVLDASEAPPTFQIEPGRIVGLIAGGDTALRKSSEGKEDDPNGAATDLAALALTPNDTLLGIAAGGTTPFVLGALGLAKRTSARPGAGPSDSPLTGLLVCSPMPKPPHADHLIILDTGPEILTGSTRMKAGTATKLALNTISTTLMVRTGRVFQNLMVDVRATNNKLTDRAARIIATLTGLARDESLALLDRAGGAVKTAVVMHSRAVPRGEAESLLQRHGGRLDAVLGGNS